MGSSLAKLFSGLSTKKEIGMLMVGLDNSGKTTIIYKLKLGKFVETEVTVGINVETLEYKDTSFTITDFAGQNMKQPYPKFFLHNVRGIIYVVDSNDRDRVFQAKDELHLLLKEDELRDAVLLVLANKQDLPNAMNAGEITHKLGLHSLHPRLWHVQSTCAVSGEGLDEGLEWLASNVGKEVAI